MLAVPASRVCKVLSYPIMYKDGWIYGNRNGKIKASEYENILIGMLNYSREAEDVYEWLCEIMDHTYDKHHRKYIVDYPEILKGKIRWDRFSIVCDPNVASGAVI